VRLGKLIRVWQVQVQTEKNRENMRSVLGWVEGERKGHFPGHRHCTDPILYHTKFLLCHCIVFGRRPPVGHHNERHYVLMIRMSASCSNSSRYSIQLSLYSRYCTCLFNVALELSSVENNNKDATSSFLPGNLCHGATGSSRTSPVILRNDW
jgi:hypothetical protein